MFCVYPTCRKILKHTKACLKEEQKEILYTDVWTFKLHGFKKTMKPWW